jgi:hypothetical protein
MEKIPPIDFEEKGNQLTLDQYEDLRILAKQLVPGGSVKTLINEALKYHSECLELGRKALPFYGLTTDLFPHSGGNQSNVKLRRLPGNCDITLLRNLATIPTYVINNQVMVPEDGLVGSSFTLKPRTQLGSFIYVMVLDYSLGLLQVLGSRANISVWDRVIEQDYSMIHFNDKSMLDGEMIRNKINIVIRNGKKPLYGYDTISHYKVSILNEHETVSLVQRRYDYEKRSTLPLDQKPVLSSNPNSGIISSNSMDKSLIREDDDFER